ncbi:hypothetical protein [Plantactinospora sp. BC1]|uniref:hypothetical protein n=1 Tax=Plantactinospora sp. BC1 TaxID=2108470 RepID=UPI001F2C26E8|nr:hypothetical protein [Plantactinospora sp. BC1]
MSLVVILIGVALGTNFRGVTEWHVRRSISTASVLRRIPPWLWLPDVSQEERLARFVLLERVLGITFAVVGVMILIAVGYGISAGQPMRTVK